MENEIYINLLQLASEGMQLQQLVNNKWCNITTSQLNTLFLEYHNANCLRAVPPKQSADAARYNWLAAYLVSTRQDVDNAIVAATSIEELSSVIDNELKKTIIIKFYFNFSPK